MSVNCNNHPQPGTMCVDPSRTPTPSITPSTSVSTSLTSSPTASISGGAAPSITSSSSVTNSAAATSPRTPTQTGTGTPTPLSTSFNRLRVSTPPGGILNFYVSSQSVSSPCVESTYLINCEGFLAHISHASLVTLVGFSASNPAVLLLQELLVVSPTGRIISTTLGNATNPNVNALASGNPATNAADLCANPVGECIKLIIPW